jgi:hypothetical protein
MVRQHAKFTQLAGAVIIDLLSRSSRLGVSL